MKFLAESSLDASTLKEMFGKNSNAPLEETRCDLDDPREGLSAAAPAEMLTNLFDNLLDNRRIEEGLLIALQESK